MLDRRIRTLSAKPGLEGHDRGDKVIAHALREGGMELIYTRLHQTAEYHQAGNIGRYGRDTPFSHLGAHVPICRKLMDMVKKEGLDDVLVVVGGVIPKKDVSMLKYLRVKRIFPGGATFDEITNFIRENAKH